METAQILTVSIGMGVPIVGFIFALGALFARVAAVESAVALLRDELKEIRNLVQGLYTDRLFVPHE